MISDLVARCRTWGFVVVQNPTYHRPTHMHNVQRVCRTALKSQSIDWPAFDVRVFTKISPEWPIHPKNYRETTILCVLTTGDNETLATVHQPWC
ncbi:hypothetical protein AVEN_194002-1 [Araneus ventricosus]|uniref:Uncharacterized protein n=1 Tax=Araneus ventricosus TaxID=182803 RepID=A0A4Y2LD47_ARAVE|nr:hypothetical protein AVEN_194002-1 [Araneus ventricosus]